MEVDKRAHRQGALRFVLRAGTKDCAGFAGDD
jgi:hypothetical protein